MKPWELEEHAALQRQLSDQTVVGPMGEIRWQSNDAVIGLDVFKAANITPPANQKKAYDQYVAQTLADYRAAQAGRTPSDEELAEMRSAFGPGTTVVNVITGRVTKL